MNLSAAYGLLAYGLIVGAGAALLPLGPLRARAGLVAATLALMAGIAPTLHGVLGAPSATLLQLAILQLAGRTPSPFGLRPAGGLLLFVLFFYPAALGWGSVDPYALGYQPSALLAALVPLAALLIWRRAERWLILLSIDLLAYACGLFGNLWDALFDPLLVLIALAIALGHGWRRFSAARNR